jgi:hypothetical protein
MGRKKKIRPEKKCPRCGFIHTKSGAFCSYSCANVRQHSEQDKQNKAAAVAAYHRTEAAEEHKWKLQHIAAAARRTQFDSTVVMPKEEDMGIPLPPSQYEDDFGSRKSGRDIWFDVD